ncbi:MAG: hypothetical protein RL033_1511 [Pseudomonadota bacterium]|jgi:hypothetical protein
MEETRRLKATLAAKVGASVARHRPNVPVAPTVEFLKPLPLSGAVQTLRAARPPGGAASAKSVGAEPASRAEPREQRAWRDAASQIARTHNPEPKLQALIGTESEDRRQQFMRGHSKTMRERFAHWLQHGAGTDVLGKKQKERLELAKQLRGKLKAAGLEDVGEQTFRAVFDGQAGPCPCCSTHDFLAEEQRFPGDERTDTNWEQFGQRIARQFRRPVMHDSDLKFDEDTSITTATERVAFADVPAAIAARFFGGADPRNWDDSGDGEFFKSTEPGAWKAGEFQAFPKGSPEYAAWCKGKPGLLQEIIEFQWSPTIDSTVEATTVLTISDLEKRGYTEDEAHPEPGTKRTPAAVTARVASLTYKFSLFVSTRSKFAVGTVPGGLDVDEGTFRAVWTHTHDAADGTPLGVLEVEADKSVHYTQPADAPPGLGTMLNLMAPPLVSILMRELVLEGTRRALS